MQFASFIWDHGNWPKCAKHGVAREEIEFVLKSTPQVIRDKSAISGEARFNAIGRNAKGRYLFIVFKFVALGNENCVRAISARYMHAKEVKRYEARKDP